MTSLPDCPRLHPDAPSAVKVTHCVSQAGRPFTRLVCSACKSAVAKAQPRSGKVFAERSIEQRLAVEKYGVHRLSWDPPERVRRDSQD